MTSVPDLTKIAYEFFPRGNYQVSEEYYNTPQILNLARVAQFHKENNDAWEKLLEKIRGIIPEVKIQDVSYNYDGWLSRSYGFIIELEETEEYQRFIDVNVSYLIPYFTIAILTFRKTGEYEWDPNPDIDFEFGKNTEVVSKIKAIINSNLGFEEFETVLLDYKINDIAFEEIKQGQFSLLNAFFVSSYRIRF